MTIADCDFEEDKPSHTCRSLLYDLDDQDRHTHVV
jgi:hypothetical protein